jgi:transporter family protein
MLVVVMLERWKGQSETGFKWRWTIPFISLFICAADLAYFYSLSLDDAMISVVSMVRRGSVIVSFMMGAFLFHEKNLKSKAVDLVLVLLGMLFLYLGTVCN